MLVGGTCHVCDLKLWDLTNTFVLDNKLDNYRGMQNICLLAIYNPVG